MTTKQVENLRGVSLDWAVAHALGETITIERSKSGKPLLIDSRNRHYTPSRTWAQGGLIIEHQRLGLWAFDLDEDGAPNPGWYAETFHGETALGDTPLIAAMRCVVSSLVGECVDIPDDLFVRSQD